MKLASIRNGSPDGLLVVVSGDGSRYTAIDGYPTLQQALEDWDTALPRMRSVEARLAEDRASGQPFVAAGAAAPLPRAWQWLDGSAFKSHGELMDRVIGVSPEKTDRPLMYQGVSDRFYGPCEDVAMPSEELGIDFEGEFGVITDAVPLGVSADQAMQHIRLLVQINDWSLRALAGIEMKTGFGWVQAKPYCSMAPFAVTPDELGDGWRNGRVCLDLAVAWNGERFGNANGGAMGYGFHELVAHAAYTRNLVAGTVIGSGTVSNETYREVGSSCIAERRGIEIVDEGEAHTAFMRFGDSVRMEARGLNGELLFGAIEQKIVPANV